MQELQEMRVGSLGWEEDMAAHSSILAWRIPWTDNHLVLCHNTGVATTSIWDKTRPTAWEAAFQVAREGARKRKGRGQCTYDFDEGERLQSSLREVAGHKEQLLPGRNPVLFYVHFSLEFCQF